MSFVTAVKAAGESPSPSKGCLFRAKSESLHPKCGFSLSRGTEDPLQILRVHSKGKARTPFSSSLTSASSALRQPQPRACPHLRQHWQTNNGILGLSPSFVCILGIFVLFCFFKKDTNNLQSLPLLDLRHNMKLLIILKLDFEMN